MVAPCGRRGPRAYRSSTVRPKRHKSNRAPAPGEYYISWNFGGVHILRTWARHGSAERAIFRRWAPPYSSSQHSAGQRSGSSGIANLRRTSLTEHPGRIRHTRRSSPAWFCTAPAIPARRLCSFATGNCWQPKRRHCRWPPATVHRAAAAGRRPAIGDRLKKAVVRLTSVFHR